MKLEIFSILTVIIYDGDGGLSWLQEDCRVSSRERDECRKVFVILNKEVIDDCDGDDSALLSHAGRREGDEHRVDGNEISLPKSWKKKMKYEYAEKRA